MPRQSMSASAVLEQLEARSEGRTVFEWLEDKAEELYALGADAGGKVQFTSALRQACNISAIRTGAVTARAQIATVGTSYVVSFNASYSPAARRFAISHEFGHALLASLSRGAEFGLEAKLRQPDRTIEAMCDYFAAALLAPRVALVHTLSRDSMSRSRPSLHLVRDVAQRFDIQERIAAWRLLLVAGLSEWSVLRVRSAAETGPLLRDAAAAAWKTVWYVSGDLTRKPSVVKGYDVPFRTHRRIPTDMIPPEVGATTMAVSLDGRWSDGIRPQPTEDARRPMKTRRPLPSRSGHAALLDGSLYVALRKG